MTAALRKATSSAEFDALRTLFREYADELKVDLCFQSFDKEIADIAGTYELAFLAGSPEAPLGCVALKRRDAARCEMKRLYVRPSARGTGLGKVLAERVVAEARALRFREMVLDTFERLGPAVRMYEQMGFERTTAFYENPEPDAVYMRIELIS